MKANSFSAVLLCASLAGLSYAAEPAAPAPETPPPAPAPAAAPAPAPTVVTEAMIRARQAERIKAKASPKPAEAPLPLKSETGAPAHLPAPTAAELARLKTETPDVLPKVEVRRSRATEIELEVFKQEKEIAREKVKTKSSDTDRALNGSPKVLKIFGGQSTTQRETVAKERVSLMESERDLMEAIAYAKTKEEKDALRKELNEIKALRRDLESALR